MSDEEAIEILFERLREYSWIKTVTIMYGGLLSGKIERRDFYIDRMLDQVGIEREMSYRKLDKRTIKRIRKELDKLERNAS